MGDMENAGLRQQDDAQRLYDNHLEEEVKKWIPNESYADLEETQGAIDWRYWCE